MTAIKNLNEVLDYQNHEIVRTFSEQNSVSIERSEKLFLNLKKWLWACAKRRSDEVAGKVVPKSLKISPELKKLDEMWHLFLEDEKSYSAFCLQYFGRLIDHIPLSESEKAKFENLCRTDKDAALRARQKELKPQLNYLYEILGPETLQDWYL